ncbi:MAG: hypothetical protein JWP89_3432 [Schlesneria sp.]|nr:hypothetical protein [Schlesneria sp.]
MKRQNLNDNFSEALGEARRKAAHGTESMLPWTRTR